MKNLIPAAAPLTSRRFSPYSKTFLKDFIPEALAVQTERRAKHPAKPFNAPFPIERQKSLGEALMKAIGFDFAHGRLDVSHHPFCGGVPSDVRMTTRYTTNEFLPPSWASSMKPAMASMSRACPRTGPLARGQGSRHGGP